MATTKSTEGSALNKAQAGLFYENLYTVTTGNMKDSKGKVVNNKYVTGRIFNDTYTLEANEEGAALADSLTAVMYKGVADLFPGAGLDPERYYSVYGCPDKWVYDEHQRYNNCGVDTCLNILSMAGIKDVIEFDKSEMDAVIDAHTTHTTDANGNPVDKVPHISFVETEQEFTLWAIQHDYCNHFDNISDYHTVNDINLQDGGSYYTDIGGESHQYHDYIYSVATILAENGIAASSHDLKIKLALGPDAHELGYEDGEPPEGSESSDDTHVVWRESGNVTIVSEDGADTLVFADMTSIELYQNEHLFSRKDDDLYINYSDANTIIVKDYFKEDPDDPDAGAHLYNVRFADLGNISTREWIDQWCRFFNRDDVLGEAYVDSNLRQYGNFINQLAAEVMAGHGVSIGGMAEALQGGVEPGTPNHAICLVGVVIDENDDLDFPDVKGFYVVDTGGGIGSGPQFITVEALRRFLTSAQLSGDACDYDTLSYISTNENIRAWADDLNLVGNKHRNTLIGNIGNNKIWGKEGNDMIYGEKGNDTLYGGTGDDTLWGGEGNNYLYGEGGNDSYVFATEYDELHRIIPCHNVIVPGSGKDMLRFEDYNWNDLVYGNDNGSLVITYDNGLSSVTVQDYFSKSLYDNIWKLDDYSSIMATAMNNESYGANAHDFYNDIITQVDILYDKYVKENENNNIIGTKLRDSIIGGKYADTISGGAGSDSINGGGGNDIIKAGADNDTIYGSYGSDKIYGEGGKNTIIYQSNYGGNDTIYSGSGEDHIVMTDKTREGLIFTQSGNDLVIIYDEDAGSSVTVQNYFSKGGNTSVKDMLLSNGDDCLDLVREYGYVSSRVVANVNGYNNTGAYGNDTLLGGAGADNMSGGLGDDVIKAGDGNDTIDGGFGNDKLYGGNGDNTFVFTQNSGSDTIYAGGNGQISIDLRNTGLVLNADKSGFLGSTIKDYAFTRTGNDLIINYAMDPSQEGTSTIVLQKYFKSKNSYNLITDSGTVSLSDVLMIYRGKQDKSNKIKGTAQGDIIFGGNKKDTIKGGDGNDSITGGLGNDVITGGKGHNTVVYNVGDGKDTINITKNEQLDIVINGLGVAPTALSYRISKGNLIISYGGEDILVLKKFGKKDVTTSGGGVDLYLNDYLDVYHIDLRNDIFLPTYDTFTSKKYKYKGKWLAERIDASGLQSATNKKGRGVSINGAGGNDVIIGSNYNDTLKGGDGNDILTGGYGKNTYDGGNGSDTYHLFTSSNDITNFETAIVKDTGKGIGDTDVVEIHRDYNGLNIWFNIDRNRNASYVFNITDESGDTATVSGVEQINANGYTYNYSNETLIEQVAGWLSSNGFSDVSTAMQQATANQINDLMTNYFNNSDYWIPQV